MELGTLIASPHRAIVIESDPEGLVDAILERTRPRKALSRHRAVYMIGRRAHTIVHQEFARYGARDPSGYIYRCSFRGEPHRHDRRWIDELQDRYLPPRSRALIERLPQVREERAVRSRLFRGLSDDQIALAYWRGDATSDPAWEYLVRLATVRRKVSDALPDAFRRPSLDNLPAPRLDEVAFLSEQNDDEFLAALNFSAA